MIKNNDPNFKMLYSFLLAFAIHGAIFATYAYVFKDNTSLKDHFTQLADRIRNSVKIDQIKIIPANEVEKLRKVGIKNGLKNLNAPDLTPPPKNVIGGKSQMSLDQLSPKFQKENVAGKAKVNELNSLKNQILQKNNSSDSSYYFSFKDKKVIPRSNEQDLIKNQAMNNLNGPMNKATEKLSNFEIRYERPEGVSEDELNSDEKAYYSFYVRSYKNYYAKIYANYEKILVERPGLAKVFDRKHLLIGKIDYDENGNIVTVRILKSSDSDDLHYFFEETLKDMAQPNPPKIFTKNRKQFSIYYQIQIN